MRIEDLARETLDRVKDPCVTDQQAMVMSFSLLAIAVDNLRDSMEVALSDIADELEAKRNGS